MLLRLGRQSSFDEVERIAERAADAAAHGSHEDLGAQGERGVGALRRRQQCRQRPAQCREESEAQPVVHDSSEYTGDHAGRRCPIKGRGAAEQLAQFVQEPGSFALGRLQANLDHLQRKEDSLTDCGSQTPGQNLAAHSERWRHATRSSSGACEGREGYESGA